MAATRYLFDHFHGMESDHQIHLWEVATGKEIHHMDGAGSLVFSPDGATLFADGVMWDMTTGKHLGEVGEHLWGLSTLAVSRDGRLLASNDGETSLLIQTMPRPRRRKTLLTHDPSIRELQALWTNLAAPDPAHAWRAMRTLIEAPRQSLPFLQTILPPHPPFDHRRLEQLLVDLDSDQFPVRECARSELSKLGELAEPALRRTLAGKPSLEVRRQVLALLEQIEKAATSPDALRILRVTTILERIGTPDSVKLLRRLAGGAAEARLTREASASLERLTRRIAR